MLIIQICLFVESHIFWSVRGLIPEGKGKGLAEEVRGRRRYFPGKHSVKQKKYH